MPAPDALESNRPPIRALLIESNPDDRNFLSRGLCALGFPVEVDLAESVEHALHQLGAASAAPDIILADLHLSDVPSTELLHWIRSRREFARVWLIALTADLKKAAEPPQRYGADALLLKPVALHDLEAVLALSAARAAPR